MYKSLLPFLLVLSFSLLANGSDSLEAPPSATLQLGIPRTEQLSGGQKKGYRIVTQSAGTWLISVVQNSIDVKLTVTSSDGSSATVDSFTYRYGKDSYVGSTQDASFFDIAVHSIETAVSPGQYTILVENLPDTTARDRSRIRAEKATSAANRNAHIATVESIKFATNDYLEALALWRDLDAPAELANALYRAGASLRESSRDEEALALLSESLSSYQSIGNQIIESEIANEIGLIHLYRGEYTEAKHSFEAALQLPKRSRSLYQRATVENNMCLLLHYQGNVYQAIDCYDDVLEKFQRIGERQRIGVLHNNLGRAYDIVGEPAQARYHLNRAISLRQEVDDRIGEATSLNNLALLERRLGNFDVAIPTYLDALAIQKSIGNKRGQGTVLHNLGFAYLRAGDAKVALSFLLDALAVRREVSDVRGQGSTLTILARAYREMGDFQRAKSLAEDAVDIGLSTGNESRVGRAYLELGDILLETDDAGNSVRILDQAIAIFRPAGDQQWLAAAWLAKGRYLSQQEKYELADKSFQDSLTISRTTNDSLGQAEALFGLANISYQQSDLTSALSRLDQSIEVFESVRQRIGVFGMRMSFAEIKQKADTMRVDVLMSLHDRHPASAFNQVALLANDRRLAQSLVDLLRHQDVDLYANIEPQLKDRRLGLIETSGAKAAYITTLSDSIEDKVRVTRATQELDTAIAQLEVLDAQIRATDQRIGGVNEAPKLTLSDMQQLLDPESVLLHYYLGETSSYLWLVTDTKFQSHKLPARKVIEDLARTVHEATSHLTYGTRCAGQDEMFQLSAILLKPVREQLKDKRLVIVPDGVLSYIAISALPDPGDHRKKNADCYVPILNSHEVIFVPSVTVLSMQRAAYSNRAQTRKAITVFADPVYDKNDIRLKGITIDSVRPVSSTNILAIQQNQAGARLYAPDRLAATGHEASAIVSQGGLWKIETFLGFDANRKNFLLRASAGARVLHIAAHGTVDSERPRLSGVVLSQYGDSGEIQDGYLRLQDIFTMKLSSGLVVLSGCETALGKEIRGEGSQGLARGFMYAGAKTVIGSLWRVDDAATATFMQHFYNGLINLDQRPTMALRFAKLQLAQDQRWRNPYYWAGFVFQGDWQ